MIRASIVGASGYTGGELLRLLLFHPEVSVAQATSERLAGKYVRHTHPNLRGVTDLKFVSAAELAPCDVLFLCLPHGRAMDRIDRFRALAERIVDLSADFRLRDPEAYVRWYGGPHPRPELLADAVYGMPELHRDRLPGAALVAGCGCNATATILALRPLVAAGVVEQAVVEVKAGSSEGGNEASAASHHPERSGSVRSYKPTGHRHQAEMLQELGGALRLSFSATAVEMVRGILATAHVFLCEDGDGASLDEKAVWRILRRAYADEPFVRIVKERQGIYRFPEPKILTGSNYCDVGFELDAGARRLVVMSALDNLMKGAAGQAVQAFNVMHGLDERAGLEFPGLHPV